MSDDTNPNIDPANRLPKPVEQAGQLPEMPDYPGEHGAIRAEQPGSAALPAAGPPIDPATIALPAAPPPIDPAAQSASHSPVSPAHADDADLIEKEWVLRAKAIVEHTKEDPHEQKKEISKFKADYIKKRYNKDLRVTEE